MYTKLVMTEFNIHSFSTDIVNNIISKLFKITREHQKHISHMEINYDSSYKMMGYPYHTFFPVLHDSGDISNTMYHMKMDWIRCIGDL